MLTISLKIYFPLFAINYSTFYNKIHFYLFIIKIKKSINEKRKKKESGVCSCPWFFVLESSKGLGA
jgi:hypothetical protein